MTTTKRTKKAVADICLYGTRETGAGYIGCRLDHGQTVGSGEPVRNRSFTEAIWLAAEDLRGLGVDRGIVRIFDSGGERMALVEMHRIPSYGNLQWQPAVVWTISVDALVGAAK
jgi:hypothetical protein